MIPWDRLQAEASEPGWDCEHGLPVPPEAWRKARLFVEAAVQAGYCEPHVAPCGDGRVYVTWGAESDPRARVWAEIGADGAVWDCMVPP